MTSIAKKEKNFGESVHHICPRSRGGSNEKDNLLILRDTKHRAIHTLFQNQLIAEQLITTIGLSEQALREDVKQRLVETLTSVDIHDPYERYKETAVR